MDEQHNGHDDRPLPGTTNVEQAVATLGAFLEQDGWHPQRTDEASAYRVFYQGDSGDIRCSATVNSANQEFFFYAYASIRVPEELRSAAAEYLARANYGLRIGNFELSFADGTVRYKSSLDFTDAALTPALISNAIYPAVYILDEYLPGLLKVIYGNAQPADAIAEIES